MEPRSYDVASPRTAVAGSTHTRLQLDRPRHRRGRSRFSGRLFHRSPARSVTVRVLGGQVERLRTEWTVVLAEGDRVLLFLAPYYASEREEDTFVPYFRGCYPVSADGTVN